MQFIEPAAAPVSGDKRSVTQKINKPRIIVAEIFGVELMRREYMSRGLFVIRPELTVELKIRWMRLTGHGSRCPKFDKGTILSNFTTNVRITYSPSITALSQSHTVPRTSGGRYEAHRSTFHSAVQFRMILASPNFPEGMTSKIHSKCSPGRRMRAPGTPGDHRTCVQPVGHFIGSLHLPGHLFIWPLRDRRSSVTC